GTEKEISRSAAQFGSSAGFQFINAATVIRATPGTATPQRPLYLQGRCEARSIGATRKHGTGEQSAQYDRDRLKEAEPWPKVQRISLSKTPNERCRPQLTA